MMRENYTGIERVRAEEEAKAGAEDDMIKQVWREKSLGAETGGSSLRRKVRLVRLKRSPKKKLI